jgi:fructokinase
MIKEIFNHQVVCFGEILWDVLPNGALPGGAPMNVAYHLKKLHHNPGLITRIGHDDWGKELIQLMERHHISTEYFQLDYELETGKVNALVHGNDVIYEIVSPVAWDNIRWEESFAPLVLASDYLVFGSLAIRDSRSRNTLFQLLELAKQKVLDINLRPPFFTKNIVEQLLAKADVLKLNYAELELITGWFSYYPSENDRIRVVQDRFQIPLIVVTKGADGCAMMDNGILYQQKGFNVQVADTIGSGDAFLAGFLSRLLAGCSTAEALEYANALGALVASYHGACPNYDTGEIQVLQNQRYTSLTKH